MPTSAETLEKGQHFIKQEGKTVFKYAVSNMAMLVKNFLKATTLPMMMWIGWLLIKPINELLKQLLEELI